MKLPISAPSWYFLVDKTLFYWLLRHPALNHLKWTIIEAFGQHRSWIHERTISLMGIILRALSDLRFPYTMFTLQTSFNFKHFCSGGGGGGGLNPLVVTVNSKEEPNHLRLLSQLRPRIRPQVCIVYISQIPQHHCTEVVSRQIILSSGNHTFSAPL